MADDRPLTLFRSAHGPVERAVQRGAFLQNRQSAIEREAILGLYRRPRELAAEERQSRREAALALLEQPEADLSPEERRVVGVLHYGKAKLEMFRVFGSAPLPGRSCTSERWANAWRCVVPSARWWRRTRAFRTWG
jgi:hypothetical protein